MSLKDPILRREYQKQWSQDHSDYYARKRNERRDIIRSLKARPCIDCGIEYPYYVMEFDHIDNNKIDGVNELLRLHSLSQAIEEAQKCEVVCANCHKIRTYKRSVKYGETLDGSA